jgi:hypothetical protein
VGKQRSYFEQAADLLARALEAKQFAEQSALLGEAICLNRLALAEAQARLVALNSHPPSTSNPKARPRPGTAAVKASGLRELKTSAGQNQPPPA